MEQYCGDGLHALEPIDQADAHYPALSNGSLFSHAVSTDAVSGMSGTSSGQIQASLQCRVQGCSKNVAGLKEYYLKRRVCMECMRADSVILEDRPEEGPQRFCHQCGKFQSLSEFDPSKRSCRPALERRRRQPTRSSSFKRPLPDDQAALSMAAWSMSNPFGCLLPHGLLPPIHLSAAGTGFTTAGTTMSGPLTMDAPFLPEDMDTMLLGGLALNSLVLQDVGPAAAPVNQELQGLDVYQQLLQQQQQQQQGAMGFGAPGGAVAFADAGWSCPPAAKVRRAPTKTRSCSALFARPCMSSNAPVSTSMALPSLPPLSPSAGAACVGWPPASNYPSHMLPQPVPSWASSPGGRAATAPLASVPAAGAACAGASATAPLASVSEGLEKTVSEVLGDSDLMLMQLMDEQGHDEDAWLAGFMARAGGEGPATAAGAGMLQLPGGDGLLHHAGSGVIMSAASNIVDTPMESAELPVSAALAAARAAAPAAPAATGGAPASGVFEGLQGELQGIMNALNTNGASNNGSKTQQALAALTKVEQLEQQMLSIQQQLMDMRSQALEQHVRQKQGNH